MIDLIYNGTSRSLFKDSICINILNKNSKACSFDCIYCDLGKSEIKMTDLKSTLAFPTVENIEGQISQEVQNRMSLSSEFNWIEISGNGEPTLHPLFDEILTKILEIRNQYAPLVRVGILTNGTHLDFKKIHSSLSENDRFIVKLDAGSDATFGKINRPIVRTNVSRIISNCKPFEQIAIQALFVDGYNTNNEDIEEWLEVVGMIQPKELILSTTTKAINNTTPVSEDFLYTLKSKIGRKHLFPVIVA